MRTLLILTLIISTGCLGQNAVKFIDPDATWNVAKTNIYKTVMKSIRYFNYKFACP